MLHESALRQLSIQAARVGAHEARVAVLSINQQDQPVGPVHQYPKPSCVCFPRENERRMRYSSCFTEQPCSSGKCDHYHTLPTSIPCIGESVSTEADRRFDRGSNALLASAPLRRCSTTWRARDDIPREPRCIILSWPLLLHQITQNGIGDGCLQHGCGCWCCHACVSFSAGKRR